ncbi:hypothetical protein ATPR_2297 [Acetobacter tropicalis NBRC 101654]|uniref:Uncharacterized protein n=1 Tax=Acetobacter tropicalis NBRC 101654 TaxID=749388 RepID=F7VFZ8_9PROT|nr:hypothetical protein [Acetobacter tropicalis]GAA09293.1 hypothetical protein ATPR_2297 [Acetobacter tropicalis NBRC 101654]
MNSIGELFSDVDMKSFEQQFSRVRAAVPVWAQRLDWELRDVWLARMDGHDNVQMDRQTCCALLALLRAFGWPEREKRKAIA